jgi:CRISPR-associated protein Csd1
MMLLTKLYELSQRKDIKAKLPIEGYNNVPLKWIVNIDLEGNLIGFDELADREKRMLPDCKRSSGIKPKLLADKCDYVFGYAEPDKPTDKVAERHCQFKELVNDCAEYTQESSVLAVSKFLSGWNPERDCEKLIEKKIEPSQVATFCVNYPDGNTIIPADSKAGLTAIESFWSRHVSGEDSQQAMMTCLVTNQERLVEERLPVVIKGVPNGQTSGTALVSANALPFTSYGLKNSLTSPICREAGEGFAKALNYLLASNDSKFILNNNVAFVFWTQNLSSVRCHPAEKDQPEKIRRILVDVLKGQKRLAKLKTNRYYAVALSASGARVVVRDWIDISLDKAIQNLINWFDAQDLVDAWGQEDIERKYLSIKRLSRCLYRQDAKKDISKDDIARISTQLVRVAIQGGRLPQELLAQLVRRNRAERDINRDRATLIKLVLTTQYPNQMINMNCLNEDPQFTEQLDRAAYYCGRLLAQLEQIQYQALEKNATRSINTTLIDRYYGAASATPGKVLGKLIEQAQPHLAQLRKDEKRVGTYNALQQQLEDILCNISPEDGKFPTTLNMVQQSIFSLGYYHQRAHNRKQAKDGAAAKKQVNEIVTE